MGYVTKIPGNGFKWVEERKDYQSFHRVFLRYIQNNLKFLIQCTIRQVDQIFRFILELII